jgi:hypothetical protein
VPALERVAGGDVIHVMGPQEVGSPDGPTCREPISNVDGTKTAELTYHPAAERLPSGEWWCPECGERSGDRTKH